MNKVQVSKKQQAIMIREANTMQLDSKNNKANKSNLVFYGTLCGLGILFINTQSAYAVGFEAEAFAAGVAKSMGRAVVAAMWLGLGVICAGALILTPGDFKVKGAAGLGLGLLGGAGLSQIQDRFLSDEMLAAVVDIIPALQGVGVFIS